MWVKGELFDDFGSATQSAQDRLDRAHQPILFDRLTWFRMLWTHCPPGEFPMIARTRAENCDAWLFLANQDGRNATALANWYTLSFRPIFTGDVALGTKAALLTALARRLGMGRSRLSSIMLSPVPENDGSVEVILKGFRRGGWYAKSTATMVNWTADVAGKSFATFWAERPGQLRNTHDRKAKKFELKIEVLTTLTKANWTEYEDIYAESWKGEEGSPQFLKEMFAHEAKHGALRLGIARLDGRAVAAQLWTVEGGTAIIHKLAYRPEVADLSAGTLLSKAMFEHVIDQDYVSLIDYGTGDEGYKADWMTSRNLLHTVELYNIKTIGGFFGALKAMASSVLRRPSEI
jgi:hypothetical protein